MSINEQMTICNASTCPRSSESRPTSCRMDLACRASGADLSTSERTERDAVRAGIELQGYVIGNVGRYMSKTSIYEAIQVVAEKVPGLKRNQVFARLWTPALGGDLTSVKCNGAWLPLDLAVDDTIWASLRMAPTTAVNEPLAGG